MPFTTSYFTPGWQKIVASEKNMRLEFASDPAAKFIVPYLACDPANVCVAGELPMAADGSASLDLPKLGGQYASLTLMPFASGKHRALKPKTAKASISVRSHIPLKLQFQRPPAPTTARKVSRKVNFKTQRFRQCWRKFNS